MTTWKAGGSFVIALTMGTCSTLSSKIMYGIQGIDTFGEMKHFQKPLMQTFLMFIAMVIALPIHHIFMTTKEGHKRIPLKKYFQLALPALFDLTGTALCMVGLLYVSVSIYQLMRCMVIVFVAILKSCFLKTDIKKYMWIGVALNAFAIIMVSASAFADPDADASSNDVAFGIGILLVATLVMSCQFVLEEIFMNHDHSDVSIPPLIVVGMEGLWGTFIMISIVFPLALLLPGSDNGSLEDVYDSLHMIHSSTALQGMIVFYIVSITAFNVSAIYVTFLMDSVWRSILANFRPVAVWGTDLILYYVFTRHTFGEAWTVWSWLQLAGMGLLFVGTAVYNASIRLPFCIYIEEEVKKQVAVTPSGAQVFNSPFITRRLTPMQKEKEANSYGTFKGTDGQGRKSFGV